MKNGTRAAVALIAAAAVNRRSYDKVTDRTAKSKRLIAVSLRNHHVDAYDYGASCLIDGNVPGDLYHHGDNHFIEMTVTGSSVDGFDYGTRSFYEARIAGTSVQVYDHGTASFYLYDVS